MSSAAASTSAAPGRAFVFDEDDIPEVCSLPTGNNNREIAAKKEAFPVVRSDQSTIKNRPSKISLAGVIPASRLAVRPAPAMVSSGIAAMDALTGGLPRGCLTEICGPASSGRTTVLLSAVAAATRRGEFCAVVDASDALDPQSAAAAGIELDRLLWVRCGDDLPQKHPPAVLKTSSDLQKKNLKGKQIFKFEKGESDHTEQHHAELRHSEPRHAEQSLEQLLRVADLLLESGGFGLIALDLGDLPPRTARRIPLTTWFRFRRAVEHTPTVLLVIEPQSSAGSCSSLLIKLGLMKLGPTENRGCIQHMDLQCMIPTHAQLLTELEITAEIGRSRMERKPAGSAVLTFSSKTAWAG